MPVLLLRLAGPMQSWGTKSRFEVRETGMEPSKSGVLGLLCSALGRSQSEPVDDLRSLTMGVRIIRQGTLRRDFQTAKRIIKAGEATKEKKKPRENDFGDKISERFYLSDADFLVGLESDDVRLLRVLYDALENPKWQLFLGRKSYPPSLPPWIPDGLKEGELMEVLKEYPVKLRDKEVREPVRLVVEDVNGEDARMDQPKGNAFLSRTFDVRRVHHEVLEIGTEGE